MTAMLLSEIALASSDVAATSSRLAKIERLATCLAQASPDEQTYRAQLLYNRSGAGQWGCGRHLFD